VQGEPGCDGEQDGTDPRERRCTDHYKTFPEISHPLTDCHSPNVREVAQMDAMTALSSQRGLDFLLCRVEFSQTMATSSHALLKTFRQIHLYIGIFIAPAILFFAFTGALQTFSLHETGHGRANYTPPKWIMQIAQLHKNQNLTVREKKPGSPPDAKPKAEKPADLPAMSAAPATTPVAPKPPAVPQKSHLPMKIFFLLVSLGLASSTITGIYMAYRFNRNAWVVTGLLAAGVVVPLLLLPF